MKINKWIKHQRKQKDCEIKKGKENKKGRKKKNNNEKKKSKKKGK